MYVCLPGSSAPALSLIKPRASAWLQTVRDEFETKGIGWALWGYDDVMGLAVARPPGPRPALDRSILTALGMSSISVPTDRSLCGTGGAAPCQTSRIPQVARTSPAGDAPAQTR